MKAIGYKTPSPIDDPESLLDIELPTPEATGHDLLVEVKAVSVNPVDVKVRAAVRPNDDEYKILGWDAAGIVRQIGSEVTLFKPGDEVFYAGSIARQGTDAEFHLVDERITGRKPLSLSFAEAAAMPLTTITAWELLFDRLLVRQRSGQQSLAQQDSLLIMGGAGGVGSILTQLARNLTDLTIISTASTAETQKWCYDLGAHHVIDHFQDVKKQLSDIGYAGVGYIASLTGTQQHYPVLVEVIAPQGKLGVIDDPPSLDAKLLKSKCASLHWEYMFARSAFGTRDMIEQHHLLNRAAELIDSGTIHTTLSHSAGTINAANLKVAHELIESGRGRGKIVLEGF
jgi:NADPH2:quinone reductase